MEVLPDPSFSPVISYTPSQLVGMAIDGLVRSARVLGIGWATIGGPLAITMYLLKGKEKNFDKKRWFWVGAGGFIILIITFIANLLGEAFRDYYSVSLLGRI